MPKVIKMRMPGFVGEASLCRSEAYRIVSMDTVEGAVVPAEYMVYDKGIPITDSGIFERSTYDRIMKNTRDCCLYRMECKKGPGGGWPNEPMIYCRFVPYDCKKVPTAFQCPTGYSDRAPFSLPLSKP